VKYAKNILVTLKYFKNPYAWIGLFFLIRLPNVSTGLSDLFEFRQTQTAWGIREVVRHGVNFFHLQLPVLGKPFEVPFEFPVFQNIAGLISRVFSLPPSTGGRLTSLIFYCLSLAMLVRLSNEILTKKYLNLLLPILMVTPYALEWSDACLIESTTTFFMLAGLWGLNRFVTTDRYFYLTIAFLGIGLAAIIKITTVFPSVIFYLYFFIKRSKKQYTLSRKLPAIIILFLCLIPALLWTKFADSVKSESIWTNWLTSQNLTTWNFGTPESRWVFKNWEALFGRLFIIGNLLIVWSIYTILFKKLKSFEMWALALAVAAPPLIYFNLYVVHDYYYIAIIFGLIFFLAYLFEVVSKNSKKGLQKSYATLAIVAVLVSWIFQLPNRNYQNVLRMPRNEIPALSSIISQNSNPTDEILVIGCDWDPTILYYADRKGIAAPSAIGNVQAALKTLLKSAYPNEISYIALCPGVLTPEKLDGAKLTRVADHMYRLKIY